MKLNNQTLISMIVISLILAMSYTTTAVMIHPKVTSLLEDSQWVEVHIVLRDSSGIDVSKGINEEDRYKHLLEKHKINLATQSHLVASLRLNEFVLKGSPSSAGYGFSGLISKEGLTKLSSDPRVIAIEKQFIVNELLDKSGPLIGSNKVVQRVIRKENLNGSGVSVCVIDSGVNTSHPALTGKIIKEHCFCRLGDGAASACCPNGAAEQDGSGSAIDYTGHGTHDSGIIASQDAIYRGIAPGANIIAIKVENSTGQAHPDDLVAAINWCNTNKLQYNISVISISLGTDETPCPSRGNNEINDAVVLNTFVAIGTGNDGFTNRIDWPACRPNAISVGATYDESIGKRTWCLPLGGTDCSRNCTDNTKTDKIACFTNRAGNEPDLFAPGIIITSTEFNTFRSRGGTSQATPHVSGAAALMYQLARIRNETISPFTIRQIFYDTGETVSGYRQGKRVNIEKAIFNLGLVQDKNITISNNGTGDLDINLITDDVSWLVEVPQHFTDVDKIKFNQSRLVNVTADTKGLSPSSYFGNVFINSNDPDENQIMIPVLMNFQGSTSLTDKIKALISKLKFWWATLFINTGSVAETDNLDFILDWSTGDDLDIILEAPNGSVYTKNSPEVNFTDGHPKIMRLSNNVLQNGTWIIKVNATNISSSNDIDFTLQTIPFPSDSSPTGINFSEVRLNYVDACGGNDNPGFRILMKGVENVSLPAVNTSNATDTASKAFLTGLVVPNDKLWLNLPRGQVLIDDNFAQTLTAHILLSSDVELKKSGKPEWLQVINNSYHYWDSIIQNTSYYNKVRNKTDWYYPDFTGQRFIIPKNFTLNGSGCDAFVEKLELSIISNITTAWVDYSDYGLNQSELDDVNNNKIPQFLTYINNQSNQLLVPALNTQVNNNATFNDMRRVIVSLGIAQWYKTLPRENMQEFKYNPSLKDNILDKKEGVEEL